MCSLHTSVCMCMHVYKFLKGNLSFYNTYTTVIVGIQLNLAMSRFSFLKKWNKVIYFSMLGKKEKVIRVQRQNMNMNFSNSVIKRKMLYMIMVEQVGVLHILFFNFLDVSERINFQAYLCSQSNKWVVYIQRFAFGTWTVILEHCFQSFKNYLSQSNFWHKQKKVI